MKSVLIIALMVIIGGAVWWSGNRTPTAEAPATTDTDSSVETEATQAMPTMEEGDVSGEGHEMMTGESTQGTDVGMELPETVPPQNSGSAMDHSQMNMETAATVRSFMVHGANFSFDPKEIRVKKGDTVTINFMSMDGFHDWVVDEFDARTEKINTGGSASVTFVADKAGTFEYYCSVGQHRANGMVGTLIVE